MAHQVDSEHERTALRAASEQVTAMGEINSIVARQQVKASSNFSDLLTEFVSVQRLARIEDGWTIERRGELLPGFTIKAKEFRWLAMILNEAITNAVKYSGLASDEVRTITVDVAMVGEPSGKTLELRVSNPVAVEQNLAQSPASSTSTATVERIEIGHRVLRDISEQLGWSYKNDATNESHVTVLIAKLS